MIVKYFHHIFFWLFVKTNILIGVLKINMLKLSTHWLGSQ